ncbi:hypothetical protein AgCh_001954 [Apium graveolens]
MVPISPLHTPRSTDKSMRDLRSDGGNVTYKQHDNKEKGVHVQVILRCRTLSEDEIRAHTLVVISCTRNRREVYAVQTIDNKQIDRTFMFDKNGEFPSDAGVIPRAVRQNFNILKAQSAEYSMKVSHLELYNEEITDLLAPEECSKFIEDKSKKPIALMEDGKGGVLVRGLEEEIGRAREAGEINKSLLTLGRVINALVEHSGHIPYMYLSWLMLLKKIAQSHNLIPEFELVNVPQKLGITALHIKLHATGRNKTKSPGPGTQSALRALAHSGMKIGHIEVVIPIPSDSKERRVFQANPRESHLVAIKRIFRYLKGTPKLGIWYHRDSSFDLTGYLDADYACCKIDRKSTTGTCQFLGNKIESWFSKKQNSVSTFTAEAEYIAAGSCCAQILWMKNQLLDYDLQVNKIPIFCYNTSVIAITENPVHHSRTKHIDIKYHFIREHIMDGTVELYFVPSKKQLADIFTKPLDESTFTLLVSELVMAPVVKIMSKTGFVYEKNNFVALVNKEIAASEDYHKMMDFIRSCKLKYVMLESPVIYCEMVEEVWTTIVYNSKDKTITFTLKGNNYCINSDIIRACFQLPENNTLVPHTDTDVSSMIISMGYSFDPSRLGEVRRKGLRKEWSFLCDSFIKVFPGKISNFDDVTYSLVNMLYMLLSGKYHNFSESVLYELGFKLGDIKKRSRNIYYARFFMLLANFFSEDLIIENPTNKLDCWVQERRVIADLNRANNLQGIQEFNHCTQTNKTWIVIILHANAKFYDMEGPRVSEVNISVPTTFLPPLSLQITVVMAPVTVTKQVPTQATKSRISKSKSQRPHSSSSQKELVSKTTKTKEGSVKGSKPGEGQGEHKRNPKDKDKEVCVTKSSHTAVSQQTVMLNKDISSLLVSSSQKDVTIETSSQPRAQAKRVRDTDSPQTYTRKKKSKTLGDTQGAHTVQTKVKDSVTTPSQSQVDVAPVNVESQPKSLIIIAPHTKTHPQILWMWI